MLKVSYIASVESKLYCICLWRFVLAWNIFKISTHSTEDCVW